VSRFPRSQEWCRFAGRRRPAVCPGRPANRRFAIVFHGEGMGRRNTCTRMHTWSRAARDILPRKCRATALFGKRAGHLHVNLIHGMRRRSGTRVATGLSAKGPFAGSLLRVLHRRRPEADSILPQPFRAGKRLQERKTVSIRPNRTIFRRSRVRGAWIAPLSPLPGEDVHGEFAATTGRQRYDMIDSPMIANDTNVNRSCRYSARTVFRLLARHRLG
jgi:hypothetical protein